MTEEGSAILNGMSKLFHAHSPFRIFAFSAIATIAMLVLVWAGMGWSAFVVAAVLIIIETAFSFDNAIINAKILARLSKFWQNMFLTVGILIAVFGMRVIFPVVLVMITAGLSWGEVVDLALHHPEQYAHELEEANPTISAYGGTFLLMLALHFFLDRAREIHWIEKLEKSFQKLAHPLSAPVIALTILSIFSFMPANPHPWDTFKAGVLGILTYMALHGVTALMEKRNPIPTKGVGTAVKLTGMAAFSTFLYLEFLDASFSFDGVIGAFAITSDVILIAAGLGVGALWVRSLTVFMVRRGTLNEYKYLDHGAHYTVFALAFILLASAFVHLPEVVTGLLGLLFITASIISSVQFRKRHAAAGK